MTDVLTGRQLRREQTAVFSSLTVARGYADLVSDQIQTGAGADTVMATVACLQEALREHERRVRIACGVAEVT